MAEWIEEGSPAPAFELKGDDGKTYRLADFKGKPVVVYFYPKDDTPGCTKQACSFRDRKSEIEELGAVVLGVSPDDSQSHAKFREKFDLNFPLLIDENHALADQFGAWGEKNMYGKKSMGIIRSTFLIGRDGKIAKAWKKVSVDGHDEQVLAAIRELPR